MPTIVYVLFIALLAGIDFYSFKIPNLIVIPAIFIGVATTGNWHWALIMYIFGTILSCYNPDKKKFEMNDSLEMEPGEHMIYGGDVKLFAMIGAFMGIRSLAIVFTAYAFIFIYRLGKRIFYAPLPLTPFAMVASLFFIW